MKQRRFVQGFAVLLLFAVVLAGCKPSSSSSNTSGASQSTSKEGFKWVVEPTMQFGQVYPTITKFSFETMATEKERLDTRNQYVQQVTIVQFANDEGTMVYGLVDYEGKIVSQMDSPEWAYIYAKESESDKYILAITTYDVDEKNRILVKPLDENYQKIQDFVPCGDGFSGMGSGIYTPVLNFWDEDINNVTRFSKSDGSIPAPSNSDKISNDTIPVPVLPVHKVTENGQEMYDVGNYDEQMYGYALNDKLLVAPAYKVAQHMWEGIAAVCDGEKWYYIDKDGQRISEQGYDSVNWEGLPPLDASVDWESRPDYSVIRANDFYEGLVAVCRNGLWGYMDQNGVEVIPCQYEEALSVYNGRAWIKAGGLWGIGDLSSFVG